jgi:peptide/nickel transport system substrate-binding protein
MFENDLRTLDPHHHNDVVAWSLLGNFYDGLVRFDPEMRLRPALATGWETLSPEQVRIHLRPGVRFHDGSKLTADDVAASLLRARDDPASRIRHLLEGVQGVTAVGPLTVDVHTSGGSPTLLNRLALVFVLPAREAARPEITTPVGTGPYRFEARRSDGVVAAEAFDGWRGRPPIATVEFAFIPDEGERARRLLTGQADLAVRLSPSVAETVATRPGRAVIVQPRTAVQMLEFNPANAAGTTARALADRRVRRALLHAIDRQRLVNVAYRGNGAVATQYVHPVVFGFDPAIVEVPHQPQLAAELLRQAGVEPGDLELGLGFGAASAELAALLGEDLTRLGVRVRLHQLSFKELMDRAGTPQITARLFGRLCTTGDAAELFNATFHSPLADGTYGGENFTGYSDAETDSLLEAASREMDPRRRLALLQQAQRRVLEALPILPLTLSWSQTGVRQGIQFTPRHDQWLDVASISRR